MDVHVIGFAKVMGDIAAGAARVVLFFLVTFVITGVLVYLYAQSHRLSLAGARRAPSWPSSGSSACITLLGYGIDPMSILVPFLVFAIAVSHGVQMVSSVGSEIFDGADSLTAARAQLPPPARAGRDRARHRHRSGSSRSCSSRSR